MITRAKDGIFKSTPKNLSASKYALISDSVLEPTCFSQAQADPKWRKASDDEYSALLKNGTWILVPYDPSMDLVGCKWVYRIKRRASIERFKARLIAKEYNQQEGVDYSETYILVVKPCTICIILTIDLTSNWSIHQLDV
ncbi:uncharacterized protein LOC113344582 [Papaver somniferum]|uniref:uncharacterized protein LOC113344582 n=1 Tax=Papaver somniferum TaxID=3469 RepID=UPI000E6FEE3A|nr:uncharacterized protein LOC113344582 [Papaver somniferum]